MKTYGQGVAVETQALVTSASDGDERSASHSGCFTLWEIAPLPTIQEAWLAPQPAWMVCRSEQILLPLPGR